MNEQFIDEVIGLVEVHQATFLSVIKSNTGQELNDAHKALNNSYEAIRAKLREFVREPKNVVYPEGFGNSFARVAYDQGWKGAERAHNIGAK